MSEPDNDIKTLEAFLIENPDLEKLEGLLQEFNLFEAVGAVRQELRHSDFLAFLLNPRANHGLGSLFVKQLLQKSLQQAEANDLAVTPLELALWDLDEVVALREWQHVDILLLDEAHQLAIIIENKVDSGEHSRQLQRYWETVDQHYSAWRILGLFLTPDGRAPSDERYISIDYTLIYDLLLQLLKTHASTIGPDIQTTIRHYTTILRRHIMPDSDIAQLCRKIYRKHQHALDLIFEHRPDLQAEIQAILTAMIGETPGIQLIQSAKSSIRFLPETWDAPVLRQGEWKESDRMLLFECKNHTDRLFVQLTIGPGPQELRRRVYKDVILPNSPPFKPWHKNQFGPKYKAAHVTSRILQKGDYEDVDIAELEKKIRRWWTGFLDKELPQLTAVFQAQDWLWDAE